MKKKVKLLRKDYSINTIVILLLIGIFAFAGCKANKVKLEVSVTSVITNTDYKKGAVDDAFIDALKLEIVKELSDGDYILAYNIAGYFIKENPYYHFKLKKVCLEESLFNDKDGEYVKKIILSPVRSPYRGKSLPDSILSFHFRNEYLLKNDSEKPIKKVLLSSGDKEYLLELL